MFQADPDYQENEEKYQLIKEEILGEGAESGSSGEEGEDSEEDSEEEEESDEGEGVVCGCCWIDVLSMAPDGPKKMEISDMTGADERSVRRQIYLTIMSSLDFEECAHKLLKGMGEGHEVRRGGEQYSSVRTSSVLAERDCVDAGGVLQSGAVLPQVLRPAGSASVPAEPGLGGRLQPSLPGPV